MALPEEQKARVRKALDDYDAGKLKTFPDYLVALAGQIAGSIPSPESLIGVPAKGLTALSRMVSAGAVAGAVNTATDPVVQALNMRAGLSDRYDVWQTVLSAPLGFATGTTLQGIGEGFRAFFKNKTGKDAPDNPEEVPPEELRELVDEFYTTPQFKAIFEANNRNPAEAVRQPVLDPEGNPILGEDGQPVTMIVTKEDGTPLTIGEVVKRRLEKRAEEKALADILPQDKIKKVAPIPGETKAERGRRQDLYEKKQRAEALAKERDIQAFNRERGGQSELPPRGEPIIVGPPQKEIAREDVEKYMASRWRRGEKIDEATARERLTNAQRPFAAERFPDEASIKATGERAAMADKDLLDEMDVQCPLSQVPEQVLLRYNETVVGIS